jgi:hypothetical protein
VPEVVGEAGLGELARRQIEAARRDPRLEREDGAVVADFYDAIEEAERTRGLGILGLHELKLTLERKERELGVRHDDSNLTPQQASTLQAYWERTESAQAEIANDYAALNAQALIAMHSALDAMVDGLAPAMREIRVDAFSGEVGRRINAVEPELVARIDPERRELIDEALRTVIDARLPELEVLWGSGASRYERRLASVGLGAPADRPIPDDLDQALTELGAIRNVLVHRRGRIDSRARNQAPSLRYHEGELVRVIRDEYRTYSAAINCYAAEIVFRPLRSWPEVSEADGPDLAKWRKYYRLGS